MTQADIQRAAEIFARDGTCVYLRTESSDFSDFIELMEAVEALCPRWPAREHRMTGDFKL